MKLGVHLPQFGRASGPDSIRRAARQAEDLGFDDVWVSDHLVVPDGVAYPPAYLYEPVITLTWAAAVTARVGLGTSVLILPYRHPVHLAKELSSLDQLSGGRVTLGAGAGWLAGEFAALGVPLSERGARTDECIDALRACWDSDPVSFEGPTVTVDRVKLRPKPSHRIPIWVGGASSGALRRAVDKADGWHGNVSPEAAAPIVATLKRARPEETFALSMRTAWDGITTPEDDIKQQAEGFAALGIDHVVATPAQGDLDSWLRSVDELWRILEPFG
ncbi:MAG: TIGR03619 family F420-dependent LLM class oxidoreductase [Acidimicrobiales bacterium]